MADNDIPTGEGGQGDQRPLNLGETNTGRSQFTRHNIATGELKEMQNELLEEVCKCIDEQTETLGDHLSDIKKDMERNRNLQPSRQFFNRKFDELIKAFNGNGGQNNNSSTGSDTETFVILKDILSNLEHITSHTANIGGAGGGGGGGGDGNGGRGGGRSETIDMADLLSTERSVESLRGFLEQLEQAGPISRAFKEQFDLIVGDKKKGILGRFSERINEGTIGVGAFVDIFTATALIELRETLNTVTDGFSRFARQLFSFDTQMNKNIRVLEENMILASAGIATAFEDLIIGELVNLFDPLNDSLKRTSRLLRENAGIITSIMLTSKGNIEAQSEFIQGVRNQILNQGFNFRARMSDDEANQAIFQMAELMKRANIREELTRGSVAAQTRKQLEFFSLIADNTGKTVDELVKANRETFKNIADLAAAGIIRPDQLEGFMSLSTLTEDRPGLQRLITAMAEAGGFAAFASLNEDLLVKLQQMGARDEVQALFDLVKQRETMGEEAFANAANALFNRIRQSADEAPLGAQGRAVVGIGEIKDILSDASTITSMFRDTVDETETSVQGMFNWIKNFKSNILNPLGEIFSVLVSGFNVGVMAAHTTAMLLHTAALRGPNIINTIRRMGAGIAAGGAAAIAAGGAATAGALGGYAFGTGIDKLVAYLREDDRKLSSLLGEAVFNLTHAQKTENSRDSGMVNPPRTQVTVPGVPPWQTQGSAPGASPIDAKLRAENLERKADEQIRALKDINNTLRGGFEGQQQPGPRRSSPGPTSQRSSLDEGSIF